MTEISVLTSAVSTPVQSGFYSGQEVLILNGIDQLDVQDPQS